jgi:hypothetical protein
MRCEVSAEARYLRQLRLEVDFALTCVVPQCERWRVEGHGEYFESQDEQLSSERFKLKRGRPDCRQRATWK